MMRTLADTLAEYRTRFMDMRQDKTRWPYFLSTAQFLANEVEGVTDDDAAIMCRLEQVMGAAGMISGGGITAILRRSDAENDRQFEDLLNQLNHLRNQLRTARPANEAKLMGRHIDQTQVPDPF